MPQYPCRGVWGEMCRYLVVCPEGKAVLIDEALASLRSACLTLHLLSDSFCVGNGPQLWSLVLADKLWFSPLLSPGYGNAWSLTQKMWWTQKMWCKNLLLWCEIKKWGRKSRSDSVFPYWKLRNWDPLAKKRTKMSGLGGECGRSPH